MLMHKTANYLEYLLRNASSPSSSSNLWLGILNIVLSLVVPFNRGHGLKIKSISNNRIIVILPYRKKNLNHVRGLHACALATSAEFATGLLLMKKLSPTNYRIIMSSMKMNYFYQGKSSAEACFEIEDSWIEENVVKPLEKEDSCVVNVTADVRDSQGEHLCAGIFEWQIKPWNKVRTKV